MAEKIIIAQLDLDVNSLIKAAADAQNIVTKLKTELAEVKKTAGETSAEFLKASADLKRNSDALDTINQVIRTQIDLNDTLLKQQQTLSNAMQQVDGAAQSQSKTFNDYKQQVIDAANSINIFNRGFGGFISRAQEAGGAGPLLKSAFSGIAEGIGGMTKASLTFIATPIGAVIAALGIALSAVISYFKNTQEGIDKVTAVTRPLEAIFEALSTVFQNVGKYLVEAFSNPKKTMTELYEFVKQNLINRFTAFGTILEGIINLDFKKISNGVIQAATGVENAIDKTKNAATQVSTFFSEAAKKGQQIDELQKKLDKGLAEYTKKTSSLKVELEAHNKVANDTNNTFAQREAAAVKALQSAKEQNKLVLSRLDLEIQLLKTKQLQTNVSDAEKQELAELLAKRREAAAEALSQEKDLGANIKSIRSEGAAFARAQIQKQYDDSIAKQNAALENYKAVNAAKAQTLMEQIAAEEKAQAMQADIFKTQLKAKKLSQTEYDNEILKLNKNTAEKISEVSLKHASAEIALEEAKNKSKISSNTVLTQDLVDEETARLNHFRQLYLDKLELEKGVNAEIVAQKDANNEALTTAEMEFLAGKITLNEEYDAKIKANQDALVLANEEHNKKLESQQKAASEAKKAMDKAEMENKYQLAYQTFGNLATIMGKESTAGKAMAVAQATMDTYKAATSAYSAMAGIPIVGPALGAVAAGAAVATGIANVKKITSTKPAAAPKAEKGALFNIGGNRHSAGGTMFTGEDGTRFEAEQGEIIGIMNRNAARHFMAFNNAFPAGGSSPSGNYFENGGIVSREIAPSSINIEELAAVTINAVRSLPAPVVAVQDIVTQGNSYVQVRDSANF